MQIEKTSDLLTTVRFDWSEAPAKLLLISDVHFDSPDCQRDLFFEHLDRVRDSGGLAFLFGDFFDVMGGQHDGRRSKSLLRPEYTNANYLQTVIEDAAEKLAPYRDNIALISLGNHETSIIKNVEINPITWMVSSINQRYGSKIVAGGYHGFVQFVFDRNGSRVRRSTLYYHHGRFGGVVSKGMQGVGRHGLAAPQADLVCTGHSHDEWFDKQARFKIKANGDVVVENQYHLKTGTYKQEFAKQNGWAIQKIAMPKPITGGWWVTLQPKDRSGMAYRFETT